MKDTLRKWRDSGQLSSEEYRELQEYARTSDQVRRVLQPLMPLLERDADRRPAEPTDVPDANQVQAIIRRITGVSKRRRPRRVLKPAFAALLILLAFSGILISRTLIGPRDRITVRFEYSAPTAAAVSIVGDFNSWSTRDIPMRDDDGDGVWTVTLRLTRDRVYTYNFLVDGETWIEDPAAHARVRDAFGGTKSVIRL
jgi:hypothetical protein